MARANNTNKILGTLAQMYPDARCALVHSNPFELLIATILSAQCTDKRVNIITERLFKKYRTPVDYVALTQEQLEDEIRDCGLFHNKAKNIQAMCRMLLDQHGGEVPGDLEALTALPGVGRKTANVVLSNAFGVPAIAVDTHVFRVSHRLGLANDAAIPPAPPALQLLARTPGAHGGGPHHWLSGPGGLRGDARTPRCEACDLQPYCPAARGILKARATRATKPARPRARPAPAGKS